MESENEEIVPPEVPLGTWLRERLKFIEGVGEYGVLFVNVIKATVKKPPALALFLKQLYDIGVASLPVVSIAGLFTGLVLAAQSQKTETTDVGGTTTWFSI